MVAWELWYRRNQMVFKHKRISSKEANNQALAQLEDFKLSLHPNTRPVLHNRNWFAPEVNALKLNIDGAIFSEW